MTATIASPDGIAVPPRGLPLAPKNPLPYRRRLTAIRQFDTGLEALRESGGSVTRNVLGPRWIMPPLVFVFSPQGAHDVLARRDGLAERAATPTAAELRRLSGDNLLVLPHREWLPRRRALQPIFTKHHVPRFGGHMAAVAEQLADRWARGTELTWTLNAAC
jgi:cytochrome P450